MYFTFHQHCVSLDIQNFVDKDITWGQIILTYVTLSILSKGMLNNHIFLNISLLI